MAMNYELHMEANSVPAVSAAVSEAPADFSRFNSFGMQVTDGLLAPGIGGANSRQVSGVGSMPPGISPQSRQITAQSFASQVHHSPDHHSRQITAQSLASQVHHSQDHHSRQITAQSHLSEGQSYHSQGHHSQGHHSQGHHSQDHHSQDHYSQDHHCQDHHSQRQVSCFSQHSQALSGIVPPPVLTVQSRQASSVVASKCGSFHEGHHGPLPRPDSFQSHSSAPAAFARDGILFGALYAIVHGCYNLVKNDNDVSGGVSDALVVARMGTHEEQTPAVSNDSHPTWSNDNRFRFRVGPARAAALELEVFDHTALRKLSLGTLIVPVNALLSSDWQRLRYPLKDGAGGELELDVRWEPEALRH